jgi:hypothetical protein
MPSNTKMPDAVGLVVLVLEMFLTVRLARDHEILSWIWILVYVIAIVGISAWHDKKALQTPCRTAACTRLLPGHEDLPNLKTVAHVEEWRSNACPLLWYTVAA